MEKVLGTWELVIQKRFDEACKRADLDYEKTKDIFSLKNKVFALLNLNKYQETIDLCNCLIEARQGESESEFQLKGVAYWMLNDTEKAVEIWKEGLKSKFKDAAGGVEIPAMLFFAAVSMSNKGLEKEALKLLKKRVKSKSVINWPGAIALYLLGRINEERMFSIIEDQTAIRARQLCQANFYVAINKKACGEFDANKKYLYQAVSQAPSSFLKPEFYLAQNEINKFNSDK